MEHGRVPVEDGAEPDRLLERRHDHVGVGVGLHACILPRTSGPVRAGTVSRLPGNPPDEHATQTLARQRIWSATANRLKAAIVRARVAASILGIVAAVLLHAVMLGPRARGERSFFGGRLSLAPGPYHVTASHGPAWSLSERDIVVTPTAAIAANRHADKKT